MKILLAAAAAFAALATAAIAQPAGDASGSNSQSGTNKSDEKGERLVCRWVQDSDVGSLVSGRTRRCLTAEQWRALRR